MGQRGFITQEQGWGGVSGWKIELRGDLGVKGTLVKLTYQESGEDWTTQRKTKSGPMKSLEEPE